MAQEKQIQAAENRTRREAEKRMSREKERETEDQIRRKERMLANEGIDQRGRNGGNANGTPADQGDEPILPPLYKKLPDGKVSINNIIVRNRYY